MHLGIYAAVLFQRNYEIMVLIMTEMILYFLLHSPHLLLCISGPLPMKNKENDHLGSQKTRKTGYNTVRLCIEMVAVSK